MTVIIPYTQKTEKHSRIMQMILVKQFEEREDERLTQRGNREQQQYRIKKDSRIRQMPATRYSEGSRDCSTSSYSQKRTQLVIKTFLSPPLKLSAAETSETINVTPIATTIYYRSNQVHGIQFPPPRIPTLRLYIFSTPSPQQLFSPFLLHTLPCSATRLLCVQIWQMQDET